MLEVYPINKNYMSALHPSNDLHGEEQSFVARDKADSESIYTYDSMSASSQIRLIRFFPEEVVFVQH